MPLTSDYQFYYTRRMKLASIIVFLAFFTAPVLLRVSLIIWRLATQGVKGADSLFVPSKSPRLSGSKKKVVLAFAFLYLAAFFASGLWMLFEVTGDSIIGGLGLTTRQAVLIGVTNFVILAGLLAFVTYRSIKSPFSEIGILKEIPRPETGTSGPEYLAWKERYSAEVTKRQNNWADHAWSHIWPALAVSSGVAVFLMVVTLLIIELL